MPDWLFWTSCAVLGFVCGLCAAAQAYARRHGPADRFPWLHPDTVTHIEDRAQREGTPPWATRR